MTLPPVPVAVVQAARQTHADPRALAALVLVEDPSLKWDAVGDQGTSFGPAQMHIGGAIGNHPVSWAESPAALLERGQELHRLNVHGGRGIAALQRPADPSGYAAKAQQLIDSGAADALLRRGGRQTTLTLSEPLAGAHAPAQQPVRLPALDSLLSMPSLLDQPAPDAVNPTQSLLDANARIAGVAAPQLPMPKLPAITPSTSGGPGLDVKVSAPTAAADTQQATGSHLGATIVQLARGQLGVPYQWGGSTLGKAVDCSGLLQQLYAKVGVSLPRVAADQFKTGQVVGEAHLQEGDAVFFRDSSGIHHVGIYIGGGRFIHAPHTGDVVKVSSLAEPYYHQQFAGGRRYV